MTIQKLAPAEITNLWHSYVGNTMGVVVSRHFFATSQDPDISNILEFSEEIARKEAEQSKSFLVEAGQPLPQPFDNTDVNQNAKPLFSDNYVVLLKYGLTQAASAAYSQFLNTSTHSEIRSFYKNCINNSTELINRCFAIMEKRGLHQPEIYIPTPDHVEKVNSQKMLAGWFADRRPINTQEIGHLLYNFRAVEIHKEFIRGAAQVTKSNSLKKHFQRGVDILQKHLEVFQSVLTENGLPKLPTWENEVLDTTISPFSERLMHYKHMGLLTQISSNYGNAISSVLRRDIGVHFTRLMGETMKYGEDGLNLMIKHNFLDEFPMVPSEQTK